MSTNKEGLTFTEWLRASGWPFSSYWPELGNQTFKKMKLAKAAWEAGEDPTEYRGEWKGVK